MKKFICLTLSLFLLLFSFTACGKNNDNTGGTPPPTPTPPPEEEVEVEVEIEVDEGDIEMGVLTPAYVFNHNMVLQRNKEVKIYGAGGLPRVEVTVEFNGQTKTTMPDKKGLWEVTLDPMEANAVGQTLKIYDEITEHVFNNVVVGEVWYCSGQSNMEMHLGLALIHREFPTDRDYDKSPLADFTKYDNWNQIRYYKQKNYYSELPHRVGGIHPTYGKGWGAPNNMKDAMDFSVYATGFALRLQEILQVPVGVVVSAVSGSSIEQWLAKETIENNNLNIHYDQSQKAMSRLYNGMTFPLNDFTVAGLLWYQGCSDSGPSSSIDWKEDMPAFCAQFRKAHGNVPVISQSLVQYNEWVDWSFIRQANYDLMGEIDGFYAVNGIDAGVPYDYLPPDGSNKIHPADKYGISKDAAEIAATNVYNLLGYNDVAEYPVSIKAEGNDLVIYYKDGVNLKLIEGTTVTNLEGLVGDDWEVITNATVNGNKITVTNGSKYDKVRYANHNVMGPIASELTNKQYNSLVLINLYSQKQGCDDLAVFPFREIEVTK